MKLRGQKKLKLFDRYLGIPIIFLLGLGKKNKHLPSQIKKVGVLLTPAIGDTILISAPLKELKKEINPEKIIFFVPEENKEAAELINIADEIIPLNLFQVFESIKKIRRYSLDLFIDSSQWARMNSLLTYFSKSKFKIGFNTKHQHRKYIYDLTANHSDKVHEIDNYKKLISLTGVETKTLPKINVESENTPNKISIHLKPGGYLSYLKEWPLNNWQKVIEYLLSKNFKIYFTGSKNDFEFIGNFLHKFDDKENLINLAGTMTLSETAVHLKSCKLVISVNTGIMHLASAVGVNLIALHGPTNFLRWGPLNKNSISIQSSYYSAPCLNLGFEYNCNDRTGECMKVIQVEEIINAVDFFLSENNVEN